MSVRTVQPERVFAAVWSSAWAGAYPHRATLVNEADTEVWKCSHRHREFDAALRCSQRERRRWVRSGKGRP